MNVEARSLLLTWISRNGPRLSPIGSSEQRPSTAFGMAPIKSCWTERPTGPLSRPQKHKIQPMKNQKKQPEKLPRKEVKNLSLKSRPKLLSGHFQVAPLRRSSVARLRRSLTRIARRGCEVDRV